MNSVKRYMNAVERRLHLPLELRARVMSDLQSSISARREQGETDEEIFASLGTPKQAAAELNEQMKDYTYRKSPWRWLFLAIAALCVLWITLTSILPHLFLRGLESQSVGIIGGADGPTAILISTQSTVPVELILAIAILAASLAAFFLLRRCRPKR